MGVTDNLKTVPLRGIWMFGLPLAATLIVAYVYIRSQNRGLEMKMAQSEQKMAVLEGEVYRLKAMLEERKSELRYLTSPDLERYVAYTPDSGYVWLFYRMEDSTWFAHTEYMNPDYEVLSLVVDDQLTGFISRISDTSGLQRVGRTKKGNTAYLVLGKIKSAAEANGTNIVAQVPL